MMRTAADAAAWVTKCQAMTERLRLREAATQEVTGSDPTARGSGPVEAVSSDAGLEVPDTGGSEPGLTATTEATVEAAVAKTSVRDAGRADVERAKEVVEPARGGSRGSAAGGAVAAAGLAGGADS
jgi:hypothetical protein